MKNLSKPAILVAVGLGIFTACFFDHQSSSQEEVPNMVDIPHYEKSVESMHRPNISRAYDMSKVAPPTMRSVPIDIARVKSTDSFAQKDENAFKLVANNPLSTFSSDVDTASYAIVRKVIESGRLPSPDMVRIEELLNSFSYNYQAPKGDEPISINLELAPALWNPAHKIARIGLQAKAIDWDKRKPFNLVFLIDTSGSMAGEMGSSHRVTALYEIVPVGVESSLATLNNARLAPDAKGIIDPLKYAQTTKTQSPSQANSAGSAEWLNVKIRYKEPANKARNDESSKLIERALDSSAILATPSADMRFAQSVAGFGLLLMDSKFVDSSFRGIDSSSKNSAQSKNGYQTILDTLSQQGVCNDSYKQEFLGLVAKASRLANLAK